jgi:hypothetical protein
MELPSRATDDETLVRYWNDGEEERESCRLGQVRSLIVQLRPRSGPLDHRVIASESGAVSSIDLTEVEVKDNRLSVGIFPGANGTSFQKALSFRNNLRNALKCIESDST